jgi:hypothetical protein
MTFGHEDFAGGPIDRHVTELFQLATVFRRAIVQCDPKALGITLQHFPNGACGDASLLLAKYFEHHEHGQFDYVLGQRNGHSHAWLQQGDLIADITADQFEDQDRPVIVTRDHGWHRGFHGEVQGVADFERYDSYTVSVLRNSFRHITRQIRGARGA